MRASPWKAGKEGSQKVTEGTTWARRLVFKPQVKQKGKMTPSIEQMAETPLKVSFEGSENNRMNEEGAVSAKVDSCE